MGFQVLDTQGRIKTFQVPTEFTFTTTGTIDNLDFSDADLIRGNNATLSTLRGLKSGYAGQRVTIVSTGAGQINLEHQHASSSAANRFMNSITSGITPLAAGFGTATYQYDTTSTRWRIVQHEQGPFINIPFTAGDYTGTGTMGWTVAAGDMIVNAYKVIGNLFVLDFFISSADVIAPVSHGLLFLLPNGYTASHRALGLEMAYDAGILQATATYDLNVATAGKIAFYRHPDASLNWTVTTGGNTVQGMLSFPLT